MAKPLCDACRTRYAQHFGPRRCRSCFTGRLVPDRRESEDDSPEQIEAKYQRALAQIRARNRPQPSPEYRG